MIAVAASAPYWRATYKPQWPWRPEKWKGYLLTQVELGRQLADIYWMLQSSSGCPDDDWSIQSKCQQVIFQAQVGNWYLCRNQLRSHWKTREVLCQAVLAYTLSSLIQTQPLSCQVTRSSVGSSWLAICWVMGQVPSLSHCHLSFISLFLTFHTHCLLRCLTVWFGACLSRVLYIHHSTPTLDRLDVVPTPIAHKWYVHH